MPNDESFKFLDKRIHEFKLGIESMLQEGGGTDEGDLYHVDVNGHGYATKEDYQERQNKMEKDPDGQWYPQQYGK